MSKPSRTLLPFLVFAVAVTLQLWKMYYSDNVPARYSHITLRSDEDLVKIATLLPSFLRDTSSLSSLASFTFERLLYRRRQPDTTLKIDETAAADQGRLIEHASTLGLPHETVQQLVGALTIGQRQGRTIQADAYAHAAGMILLSLTANLDTLRLEELQVQSPIYTFLRLNNYNDLPKAYLHNLKSVYLGPRSGSPRTMDPRFYRQMDLFLLLRLIHRLPNLESVTADAITEGSEENIVMPAHLSNVRTISITHSSLSSLSLATLIRLPKQHYLKEFRYTAGGRAANLNGSPIMQLKTIGKALESQKLSLRVLDLDIDENVHFLRPEHYDDTDAYRGDGHWAEILDFLREDPYFIKDETDSEHPLFPWDVPTSGTYGHTIGSLADFTALESLRIGVKALLGPPGAGPPPFKLIDALPVALREFTLLGYCRGDDAQIDSMIDEVRDMKDQRFPFLTKVKGLESTIMSGHSNYDPDRDEDIMWKHEKWDGEWQVI